MENIYKNSFHIEPANGLLNDPNGLIQFKGTYYFFHQWNRFKTDHSYKEWGLATSKNLTEWTSVGSAIVPDQNDDKNGVYSGSAIEDDDKMVLFYTGNSRENGKRKSLQKIAISEDGQTFIKQKYSVETPSEITEHHRDPKVWRKNDSWWMIVGAQTKEEIGAVTLFQSTDLLNWIFQGIVYSDKILEQMCECPDIFSLGEEVDILTVCPQKRTSLQTTDQPISSYSGYLVGKMDYNQKKFKTTRKIQKLDQGFDFYAPQSFEDDQGRRIIVGWMSRMTEDEEQSCPTREYGYVHCLTMPRELKWINNQLFQLPLKEFEQLRKNKQEWIKTNGFINNRHKSYELIINFTEKSSNFCLTLNSNINSIEYKNQVLKISRINWVSKEKESKYLEIKKIDKMQIFCDGSTMEVFVNDGQFVFSMRTFCKDVSRDISYRILTGAGAIEFYNY